MIKKVGLFVLAAALLSAVFVMAGCGDSSKLEGTYKLSGMVVQGKTVTADKVTELGYAESHLDFNGDSTISGQLGPTVIPNVKFTREGDDLKLETGSDGYTFTVNGNDIVLEYHNSKLTFTKS